MDKRLEISKERQAKMRSLIMEYFARERDEDLGDLASGLILDFFIQELGPSIYNQGVEDARIYIRDKLEDLYALEIVRR